MKNIFSFLSKHYDFIFRLGLASVLVYAGVASLLNPQNWVGFVPNWIGSLMPRATFLLMHGVGETLLGVLILFKILPKLVYAAAALDMLAILVFYGIDDISFRDIGLFFLALGLWGRALQETQ